MTTHLQLLFMKVILFAIETSATKANLERVDNSFCCDCGAYFLSLKKALLILSPGLFQVTVIAGIMSESIWVDRHCGCELAR